MGFLRETLILSLAGILVRLLGAGYRIILPRLIGAEGIGIYQMALPVYTLLLVIAVPGLPLALSKLIAEEGVSREGGEVELLFYGALTILFLLGIMVTAGLWLMAPLIAGRILGDARSLYPLMVTAPSLFFVFIMAAFRGYFQGQKDMLPTALSLVIEQMVRLVTILVILLLLSGYPLEYMAGGAALGNFTGALAGFMVLFVLYLRQEDRPGHSLGLKRLPVIIFSGLRLLRVSVPISVGSLIMPLMALVDAVIVPHRLRFAGNTLQEATALYGQLSGMAMAVFFFPTVISGAMAISLLPVISEARVAGDYLLLQQRSRQALRLIILVMLPATLGMMVLAEEICALLFGYPAAGIPLFYLSLGLTLFSLQDVCASILQGLDLIMVPAINLLVGAVLNAGLNYYLTPRLGIRGAALATAAGFIIAGILNLRSLSRQLELGIKPVQHLFIPLISALGMGALVHSFYQLAIPSEFIIFNRGPVTLMAILIGIVSYPLLLFLGGGMKSSDLESLPYIGPLLAGWLNYLP